MGNRSARVARFVVRKLEAIKHVQTQLIDLADYDIAPMAQRLDHMQHPPAKLSAFSRSLTHARGLVIVAPEYKNGYPGVLKNAFDYLAPDILRHKPVGICTVSSGAYGGVNCLAQLRLGCLALGGLPIPDRFPVAKVEEAIDAQGNPSDPQLEQMLARFLEELIWYTEAMARRQMLSATS